jgi:hypothetical protein
MSGFIAARIEGMNIYYWEKFLILQRLYAFRNYSAFLVRRRSYETNPSLQGKQKMVEGCPKKTINNPERFVYTICQYVYDPQAGIEPVLVF